MFLVAGYESAYASGSPGVWAHKWNICSGAEGVTIPETDGISSLLCSNGYSRFGELQGDHDATIGIISHELGHALAGLPDLYSTNSANDIAAIEDVTDFRFPHDKKVSGEVSKTNSSEAHPLSLQF